MARPRSHASTGPSHPQGATPAQASRNRTGADDAASKLSRSDSGVRGDGVAADGTEAHLPRSAAPETNEPTAHADAEVRRVELILQQLEALPTLPAVALRVFELTSDDAAAGKEVAAVVSSDPALASRVLKMVRCSERGRTANITNVDRAVLMLGFEALRSAVLSVQVFDVLNDAAERAATSQRSAAKPVFDRAMFWQHSLAVAIVCEQLAGTSGPARSVDKADAFTAGLLHDLGVLALHVVLPAAFDRVCEYAEVNGLSLDQASRRIIGIDTHTAGRRLAEHWRLPHALGDVLWLNGQRPESLPDLPHKPMIALVSVADAIARSASLAPAGHGFRGENMQELLTSAGFKPQIHAETLKNLHSEVAERCESLGMSRECTPAMLLKAFSRANEAIGRINAGLRSRATQAQRQTETLQAIARFHDSAAPGGNVVTVMGKVVESAASLFEGEFFGILYQSRQGGPWQFIQFARDGRVLRSEVFAPPPGSTAMADLADNSQISVHVMGMLPWLADYMGDASDLRRVHLLPLRCGWGVNAVLLHDCAIDGREQREQLDALGRTWAAAIAAGAQHEGAKRLGERLAESNRALIDTQAELSRREALASLGEIAAGAAHEMNNPLCIISGRSQLLASLLHDSQQRTMAQQIVEQSHRLSDMITSMRRFAEPLRPNLRPTVIEQLLDASIVDVRRLLKSKHTTPMPDVKVVAPQGLGPVLVDPEHMQQVFVELLRNAVESAGCAHIECSIEIEPAAEGPDVRLKVRITDDGAGLTPHALAHAFDPFFSAKPAGRQPGLGLAHARRIVEAHGGQISLENTRTGGAVATIRLECRRSGEQTEGANHPAREAA